MLSFNPCVSVFSEFHPGNWRFLFPEMEDKLVRTVRTFIFAGVWVNMHVLLRDSLCANTRAPILLLDVLLSPPALGVLSRGYLSNVHQVGLWASTSCSWGHGPKWPLQRGRCMCVCTPSNWAIVSSGEGGSTFLLLSVHFEFIFAIYNVIFVLIFGF